MLSGQFKKIPMMYKYALAAFTIIALSAIAVFPKTETIAHFVVVLLTAIIADLVLRKVRKKNFVLPYSAYISGIILSILMPFETTLATKIAVPLIAIALKHAVRFQGRHIFNPASSGIVAASLIPGMAVAATWWGTIAWPLVAVVGLLLMYKIGYLRTGLSFYLSFAIIQLAYNATIGVDAVSTVNNFLLSGSLLFFGFFMVIEPNTSPFTHKGQILFGTATAVLAFASQFFVPQWFPLIGLLIMNIFTREINKRTFESTQAKFTG